MDNFEEVRSGARAKRVRRVEPLDMPIVADIAAVTLVEAQAPEPVAVPAVEVSTDQPQEESTMATTAETITNTDHAAGTKLFADVNDRAKGAMERGTKLFAEMNGFTKGNVEALVESGRIAARGMEGMGQESADYARRSFETMAANLRALAAVKSPTELVKLQAEQTRAAFDQAVAQTSHSTEAMLKLAGEIAQPISNRVAVVADRMKTAA